MKVTIVSSNIKETFPQDGRIIFIGEWCLKYPENKNNDCETYKYHWNRPNRFYEDVEFLENICQEYLAKTTNILNKIGRAHV